MNTGKITHIFRLLGLMHMLDKIKFYYYLVKNRKSNNLFKKEYPEVVLPPDYMMFEAFQLNYRKYYFGGRKTAEYILKNASDFIDLESKNILDWGCGPARVIRHMPLLTSNSSAVYGTDYNAKTIAWCTQHIPNIEFRHNLLDPPLSFNSDFFDMIYGISIFTHLSETRHHTWFQELLRVSKTGAVMLLTTHGDVFKSIMTEQEKIMFDKGLLVTRSNVVEGHRVYAAFHPVSFMKNLFAPSCEILRHEPGKTQEWGMSQDLWVVRKK